MHVSENVLLAAVNDPVPMLPDVGLLPDHAALAGSAAARQPLAFDADHVIVELPPLTTFSGLAVSDTVGAAGGFTITVTDFVTAPPAPVHVSEKLAFELSAPVDSEPVVGLDPLHAPDALQVVALVAVQLNVAAVPLCTVPGLAANANVGAGTGGALRLIVTVCVAVPPAPLHERENALLAVSSPVD